MIRHTIANYRQEAHGRFKARIQPRTAHCGPVDSAFPVTLEFGYRISLVFHAQALDERGFLLDNLWFGQYLGGLAHTHVAISCELLAETIAKQICDELGDRTCLCEAVMVSIEPFEGVSVTAVMRSEKPTTIETNRPTAAGMNSDLMAQDTEPAAYRILRDIRAGVPGGIAGFQEAGK